MDTAHHVDDDLARLAKAILTTYPDQITYDEDGYRFTIDRTTGDLLARRIDGPRPNATTYRRVEIRCDHTHGDRDLSRRCSLAAGHGPDHIAPDGHEWTNDDD